MFQGHDSPWSKPPQKTDARMACNTLLLSDDGRILRRSRNWRFLQTMSSCAHGATVTDILDHDHLFYLRAREEFRRRRDARAILVKAFVEESVRRGC